MRSKAEIIRNFRDMDENKEMTRNFFKRTERELFLEVFCDIRDKLEEVRKLIYKQGA